MATYYFRVKTGEPFTDKTDAGDDAVAAGEAVKTDSAPASVESWRMKYNFSTNSVDVYEDGKTNDEAVAAKLAASEAEAKANSEKDATRAAAAKADA
jgi:hypothetical protein